MTVAIPCAFQDGVLFCADTKITTEREKSHESKIHVCSFERETGNGLTVFTLSGDVAYATSAIEKCERAIAKLDFSRTSLDEIQDAIETALVGFYQMHVFPHPDRLGVGFDLLIGVWLNGKTRILSSFDTALRIVNGYDCVGAGGYLARYWLRQALGPESRFKPEDLTLKEATFVVECAINNVVEYDESCDYDEQSPISSGEAEYMGITHNGEIGDLRQHAYLGDFPKKLQSESWGLLRRLAKAEDVIESEIAVDDFCATVRTLHEPVVSFMSHYGANETKPDSDSH